MTAFTRLRLQVFKEVRELLPAWLACLAAIATPSIVGRWYGIEVLAYGLGTAALGSVAIGHEYGYRTLPAMLAQPVSRRRLFLMKMAIVAAMLAPICYVFASVVHWPTVITEFGFNRWESIAAFSLPVLGGLLVAPWITMLTRNPVAGTVLAPSIFGTPMSAVALLNALTGLRVDPPRVALWASLALCGIAAVAAPRLFMRLEVADAERVGVALFRWLRRQSDESADRALTRRHPAGLLLRKELRLQRMTFLLAALYPVGWMAAVLLRTRIKDALTIFYIASLFHALEMALLTGSLASAEERQVGTLEWQLLMPFAVWKQWLIKAAVVLVSATTLGCVLPAVAASIVPAGSSLAPTAGDFVSLKMLLSVVVIAAVSLCVSSVSGSGLRALLAAVPVWIALASFGVYFDLSSKLTARPVAAVSFAAIGTLVMLACGLRNHRLADAGR